MAYFSPQALIRMAFNNQTGAPEQFPSISQDDPEEWIRAYVANPERFSTQPAPIRQIPNTQGAMTPEAWAVIQRLQAEEDAQNAPAPTPDNVDAIKSWLQSHLPNLP
jgi:hypothetical protein